MPDALRRLLETEEIHRQKEQVPIVMKHVLHAGMYSRTAYLEAGVGIIGVLIKIPTQEIVHGSCFVYDGQWKHVDGYRVLAARAGRKQAFAAVTRTEITMIFPSNAKTVGEAEAEFTDEGEKLLNRAHPELDFVTITS
jgi:hypothetical protein